MPRKTALERIFDGLWDDYVRINPQASAIHRLLTDYGERVVNDHVAFRTFDVGPLDMRSVAARFERHGYREKGRYDIRAKKVDAIHLDPPAVGLPKVFVSQLRTSEFSPDFRAIVADLTRRVPKKHMSRPDLLWSGAPWGPVPFLRYERLRGESEYAAWLSAFGIRANHFTVSVNALERLGDIRRLNALLKGNGFVLNAVGGEVKGGPGVLLEQSSTMAAPVTVAFSDGARQIPGCYYEFAKRYPGPDGRLFGGFVESSANDIFESTTAAAARVTPPNPSGKSVLRGLGAPFIHALYGHGAETDEN